MMQVQSQIPSSTELFSSDEDCLIPLTEDEQDCIQGGWLPAVALGLAVYVAFTTPEERIEHRDFALTANHYTPWGQAYDSAKRLFA